jgi:hypothetical protein
MRLSSLLLLLCFCTAVDVPVRAADTACIRVLQQKRFVFHAEWATGLRGARRQLIPRYDLVVSPDSVAAYLPYYGRMYTVPTPEELRFMAISFTSLSFDYKLRQSRRRLSLIINPKDQRNVLELDFNFTPSCACTLTIRSAGRDPMFYEGTIESLP